MPTASLDEIGMKHGTDKSSLHHGYLAFYEMFFAYLRERPITLLEVGVYEGASLKTWKDYFPNAKIVGAEISPMAKRYESDRVSVEILDQSNVEELTRAAIKHGPFDIIIEDGSHMWEHQITSFRTLFPFVKPNGIYIVEDLHTNYGQLESQYKGVATRSCMDYLKNLVDLRVADNHLPIERVEDPFLRTYGRMVQLITFHRRACLIKKQYPVISRERHPGRPIVEDAASAPAPHVTAHVSGRGDILGMGGYVNLGADEFALQGIIIETEARQLEYRVRGPDKTWSEWVQSHGFVGTRGQAKLLTGFTIRVKPEARERFALRAFGRFAGVEPSVEVGNEQDCVGPTGETLCGIQVALTERS